MDEVYALSIYVSILWALNIFLFYGQTFVDSESKFLGNKTTTLEFTGILFPFLSYPELLTNQTVVVQVDNIGCHFAWENGYATGWRTHQKTGTCPEWLCPKSTTKPIIFVARNTHLFLCLKFITSFSHRRRVKGGGVDTKRGALPAQKQLQQN